MMNDTNEKEMKGYIYILKNPSFPDYIKIGYADNIERRLKQLNHSECIPFAFRVFATYEVNSRLSDKKIHSIIDKLNPELRSIDNFDGKKRIREFYAMSAEDAYAILEAIAEIHNRSDKLKKWDISPEDLKAEKIADEVKKEKQTRGTNFTFDECQVPVGAILEYVDDSNIKCTVVDERRIEYNGEIMYITPFAKIISGKSYISKGPRFLIDHFKYNGILLKTILDDLEKIRSA